MKMVFFELNLTLFLLFIETLRAAGSLFLRMPAVTLLLFRLKPMFRTLDWLVCSCRSWLFVSFMLAPLWKDLTGLAWCSLLLWVGERARATASW